MEAIYLYLFLAFLVYGLIVFLFYKILKSLARAFLFTSIIFTVFSLILAYVIYSDMADLAKNFPTSKKLFLVHDNNKILSGFSATTLDERGISVLMKDEINSLNTNIKNGYSAIIDGNYKVILLDIKAFEGEGTVKLEGMDVPRKVLVNSLKAENPNDVFADYYVGVSALGQSQREEAKKQAEAQFGTDAARIKTAIFTLLVNDKIQTEGPLFFRNFKDGNLKVYPETVTFKLFKIMPDFAFEMIGNKIVGENQAINT